MAYYRVSAGSTGPGPSGRRQSSEDAALLIITDVQDGNGFINLRTGPRFAGGA